MQVYKRVKVVIQQLPHSAHCLCHSSTQPQPAQPGNTTCGIKQSCSPDDGHNDARNMLRVTKFILHQPMNFFHTKMY